jgi:hypothetical protein
MLGQEVAKLADGSMTTGMHQVTFDGSGMASGIYFYRLSYGDVVKTRKMMQVK